MDQDREPGRGSSHAVDVLRRFVGLQELSAALAATVDRDRVAEHILRDGTPLVGAAAAAIYCAEEHLLRQLGTTDHSADELRAFASLPLDAPVPLAEAARRREEVRLEDPEELDRRYPALAELRARVRSTAWVALPLVAGERLQGVLGFVFEDGVRFDETDRALQRSLAAQCAQALARCRLFAEQVALREEAERAAARERQGALCLAESRALLDALIQATPVGIVVHDEHLRVVRMNPALGEMIGHAPEDCVGLTAPEISGVTNAEELHAWLGEALRGDGPIPDREVTTTGPGGPSRTLLASLYPVDHEGRRLGVAAVVRDVTREHRDEEFRRHVLGMVGHDLRTPLAAIELSVAALLRRGVPERDGAVLGRVRSSVARMERIIRDLLDFARVSAGAAIPIAPRDVDLAELCGAVLEEARAANPGRTLVFEGEGDPRGLWDPDRLVQALGNLVGNALQHGRPDRPVTARFRDHGDRVEVEIRNEGEPIPDDLLERIFEPFRGGARTRQAGGGLGLGLFIARELIAAHGGAIEARSAGGTTSFTVRLPRRIGSPASAPDR